MGIDMTTMALWTYGTVLKHLIARKSVHYDQMTAESRVRRKSVCLRTC
jgi:hypothetical protein